MTPQDNIYALTYQRVLERALSYAPSHEEAVKQASEAAAKAVSLYPVTEPAKRGPGRPPKE